MLELNKVNTYYGTLHILKDVSLKVEDGELVSVIGANGAGKTTLLRTISGFIHTVTGSITYNGKNIRGMSPDLIVKEGICQIPEGRQLYPAMTVKENIELGAYLRKDKTKIAQDLEWMYELFPILKQKMKQQAGMLSGGQQQMVAIARGLMSSPKVLLLDEPSWGLSPILVEEVANIIKEVHSQGMAVMLNEQNANIALQLANRGYAMEMGQIVLEGTGNELLNNDDVRKAYLGM